jgi:hypothetical protein
MQRQRQPFHEPPSFGPDREGGEFVISIGFVEGSDRDVPVGSSPI